MGTIGQTNTGTNADWYKILDLSILRKDELTVSGQRFTKVSAYLYLNDSAARPAKGLLYAADGTGGIPGTLLAVSDAVSVSAGGDAAWYDFSFNTPYEAATGYYWHGVIFGANPFVFRAAGSTGATARFKADTYSDGPLSPYGGGGSAIGHDLCCYLTYEAVPAAGLPLPLLNQLLL